MKDGFSPMAHRIWHFAEFEFYEDSLELRHKGVPVPAQAQAREVLCYLLINAGLGVLSTKKIKMGIWKTEFQSGSSVNVAINKIRDAFGDKNRERILRTVRGDGYAWAVEVVEVTEVEEDQASHRPEFCVGQQVPGRNGWLFTQRLYADEHRETWLVGQPLGELQHVVQLAWEGIGLGLLRAEARVLCAVGSDQASLKPFSRLIGTQFDEVPYLLETEYLGPTLTAWAALQQGLGNVSESLRVAIVAAAATALDTLHRLGEVHGALTAESVHVLQQGDEWIIRIDGFGHCVRESPSSDDAFCRLPGAPDLQSPSFRAQELEGSQVATREGDNYALGVLLYQCAACNLSGRPIAGWEAQVPDAVLRKDIAETANIDPASRTRKPADLAKDLRGLAARRLAEEQLAESRREREILERRLAVELARRPLQLALACALVLLGLVLTGTAALQMRTLKRERDQARDQKRDADTLQRFFEQLFFEGDATIHGPVSPEALVERGLEKARVLEGAPRIHSAILNTLGVGLDVLGRYSKADTVLDEALRERRKLDGDTSPAVADTLLRQAALKNDEGQPRVAMHLAEQAFDIEKHTLAADDIAISRTRTQLAEDLTELGEYDQSVAQLEQSVAQETGHPEMLAELSTALNDLSIAENYRNHIERSLDLQEQSMQIDRAMLGDRHPDIAAHLLSISNAHLLLGQTDQGVAEARQALSIYREWLPADHHEIAAAEVMLADGLSRLPGKTAEAEAELEPALEILRRGPAASMTTGHALIVLCRVRNQQGRLVEAIAADKRALNEYQTLYPKPHFTWTSPLAMLADLYIQMNRWNLAKPAAEQAWQIAKLTSVPEDPRRLNAELVLAKILVHEGRISDASTLMNDVVAHAPEGDLRTRDVRGGALMALGTIEHEKS